MKNKLYNYISRIGIKISIFGILLLVSTTNAQNIEKDSIAIQKLLSKEITAKDLPTILVFDSSNNVELISNYIVQKNKEKSAKETAINLIKQNSLGKRYLNGDKSTIDEIVRVFKSRNKENIHQLCQELQSNNFFVRNELRLDSPVLDAISTLLNDEDFEGSMVQFIGFNKITNSQSILEKRLLSGKSKDVDRILYWISEEGNTDFAVDYLFKSYFDGRIRLEKENWITTVIENCLQKTTSSQKKKILDILFDYLNKNPIKKEDFINQEVQIGMINTSPKFYFFDLILKYGDERTSDFVENFKKSSNKNFEELHSADKLFLLDVATLRFKKKNEKIQLILSSIEKQSIFFDVLELAKTDTEVTSDSSINNQILINFEKLGFKEVYNQQILVNWYSKFNLSEFIQLVRMNIKSGSLQEKLIKLFTIENKTFDDIQKDLLDFGIINQPISTSQIEEYKKDEFASDDLNDIYTVLEISKLIVNFDTEASTIPVDYDNLLNSFIGISCNKVNKVDSYLQVNFDEKSESTQYRFFVHFKEKCYVMIPEDFGDWYDVETFVKLLNIITNEAKTKEKYISIGTGDQTATFIFTEMEKYKNLNEMYNLEYEYEE